MNQQRQQTITVLKNSAVNNTKEAAKCEANEEYVVATKYYLDAKDLYEKALKHEKEKVSKDHISKKIAEVDEKIAMLDRITKTKRVAVTAAATTTTVTQQPVAVGGPQVASATPVLPPVPAANVENVTFDSISGLVEAKKALYEAVVYPRLHPQFYENGISKTKGILLYGPPGTGKTQLAKAVASQMSCSFHYIKPTDIFDKYQGASEQNVAEIFNKARREESAVIFIDEVDSILSERTETNSETSSRVKTLFMTEMNGIGDNPGQNIFVLAATNIPWNIDSAVLRRFTKKIYIPLPDRATRADMFKKKLGTKIKHTLGDVEFETLADLTEGYSGSDIHNFVADIGMEPFRKYNDSKFFVKQLQEDGSTKTIPCSEDTEGCESLSLEHIPKEQVIVFPITIDDFLRRKDMNKKSVGSDQMDKYAQFTKEYGINAN